MTRAKSRTDQPALDNDLSEHEWRLKMAVEGKAIYVPGKTVEEMKATMDKTSNQISRRTITLTDDEWSGIDTAIPDIIELLADVRNVFQDISYLPDLDLPGVNSMLRLAGRAVQSMESKEIQVLDRLDVAVRSSKKEMA